MLHVEERMEEVGILRGGNYDLWVIKEVEEFGNRWRRGGGRGTQKKNDINI